jgi:ankyrin repeat protein
MKTILFAAGCAFLFSGAVRPALALTVILPPDRTHTRLHAATELDDLEQTRAVLKALPRAQKHKALNQLDRDGYTPLSYAARNGNLEAVQLLVKAGASVDVAEELGWTPLMQAADQRHAAVALFLLKHGANPNPKTRLDKTPLSVALGNPMLHYGPPGDRESTVQALLENHADAAPLLAAYDGWNDNTHEQRQQIDALQAERQRLIERIRQSEAARQQMENELHRLAAECQRLNEVIEKIRSATGQPGYHPVVK